MLRIMFCVIFASTVLVASFSAASADEPIPARRVAVMNLSVSGDHQGQVREWLPAMIEERLLEKGWALVVRGERMQHIQEERTLPGVNPETRVPDNQLYGATALLELSARVKVDEIQAGIGYKSLTIGGYVTVDVDINGQIIDPATGLLKTSITARGTDRALKTVAVVALKGDWRFGNAAGINLVDVRRTLVGKAADKAVKKLANDLDRAFGAQKTDKSVLSKSASAITAEKESTILISLPEGDTVVPGDRYGVYRGHRLIAELEVIMVEGRKAVAKVISISETILPTDKARRMPIVINAE